MTVLSKMAVHELIWARLRELEISTVEVGFSGSGDSGQIDGVDPGWTSGTAADQARRAAFLACTIDLPDEAGHVAPRSLRGLIDDWAGEILDRPEIPNWYDNDGGNGKITFHVSDEPPRIEVGVNVAVVTHETHSFEYDRHGDDAE